MTPGIDPPAPRRCVVVGGGRAGGAFLAALTSVGWQARLVSGRRLVAGHDDPLDDPALAGAGSDPVELILLAVPDGAVADVAGAIPATEAVVAHVSGSLGPEVLAPHRRVGVIHPLMSLPDPVIGAERLLDGCTFAVAGDPLLGELVEAFGGVPITVGEDRRRLYHGVATIAANHLTALCAQVERLAGEVGVPAAAYWKLMGATLQNVERVGARAALTGPAARGDWDTIRGHLAALPSADERRLYIALGRRAAELAGVEWPDEIESAP